MKKADVKKEFLEMLDNKLLSQYFEKKKTNEWIEYIRYTKYGFCSITPIINQYDTLFFISITFGLRIDKISEITTLFSDINPDFSDKATTINFGFDSLTTYNDFRIKVETSLELDEALKLLKGVLVNEAAAFFEKFKTVEDMDLEVNRENLPKDSIFNGVSVQPFIGLTSAVLNKNPKSKYWLDFYRRYMQNANQHLKNQYEKLVDYLKENYPEVL